LASPLAWKKFQDAFTLLHDMPKAGIHMKGRFVIDALALPADDTVGKGASSSADIETMILSLDTIRLRTNADYRAYTLLRAENPLGVELDAQVYASDTQIGVRFDALSLLEEIGISITGSWIDIAPTSIALPLLDQLGLPGSVVAAYIASNHGYNASAGPLLQSFMTPTTLALESPVSGLRDAVHVYTYPFIINIPAMTDAITSDLRMRGGMLLLAETMLRKITNSFSEAKGQLILDAESGIPLELSLVMKGVGVDGVVDADIPSINLDMTFVFSDTPGVAMIEAPKSNTKLPVVITAILKALTGDGTLSPSSPSLAPVER
jgi:hypothetical protein